MSQEYVTVQDDMIDRIAFAHYGYAEGGVEAILSANPGLSSEPPMLPVNLTIELPALAPQPSPPKQTVQLWD